MEKTRYGLADHWIRNIRDIYFQKRDEMLQIKNKKQKLDRLCELNVIQQVANVAHIPAVQQAWQNGQELSLHGWIYDIGDGLLKKLIEPISDMSFVEKEYQILESFEG